MPRRKRSTRSWSRSSTAARRGTSRSSSDRYGGTEHVLPPERHPQYKVSSSRTYGTSARTAVRTSTRTTSMHSNCRRRTAVQHRAAAAQHYVQQLEASLPTEEELGAASLNDGWSRICSAIGTVRIG
uniref:(northern house mosquito) hypothetical protein n=1 Tax=Culex pipiens TaxID=7175 RepID=A0A8D8C3W3_CULPI